MMFDHHHAHVTTYCRDTHLQERIACCVCFFFFSLPDDCFVYAETVGGSTIKGAEETSTMAASVPQEGSHGTGPLTTCLGAEDTDLQWSAKPKGVQ